MQKNDKFYTFLLSHSSRSRIYIKRIEVSKKLLHNTAFGFAAFLGVSAITAGIFGAGDIASFAVKAEQAGAQLAGVQVVNAAPATHQQIDYSRPGSDLTVGSGGPYLPEQSDEEDAEMDRQLQLIQTTSNPASIPSIWAHLGKINNEFGFRRNPFGGRTYEFHAGMDIGGERGDMVVAPASGTISKAGWQGGYGNMIEIDHGNGLTTRYGHLSKIEISEGDQISRGQLIGLVGSTGRSTGPHLHYELRLNDKPINPRRFLPQEPIELKKAE